MPAAGAPTTKTIKLSNCQLPATANEWAIALRPASGTPAHSFDWFAPASGAAPTSTSPNLQLQHMGFVKVTAAGVAPVTTHTGAIRVTAHDGL